MEMVVDCTLPVSHQHNYDRCTLFFVSLTKTFADAQLLPLCLCYPFPWNYSDLESNFKLSTYKHQQYRSKLFEHFQSKLPSIPTHFASKKIVGTNYLHHHTFPDQFSWYDQRKNRHCCGRIRCKFASFVYPRSHLFKRATFANIVHQIIGRIFSMYFSPCHFVVAIFMDNTTFNGLQSRSVTLLNK